MTFRKTSRVASLLAFFSLLAQLCAVTTAAGAAGTKTGGAAAPPDKISHEIRERLQRRTSSGQTAAAVILQLTGKPSGRLNALLNRNGVHVRARFDSFDSLALELPLEVIEELASFPEARFVSTDAAVQSLGHVTATTGTDARNDGQLEPRAGASKVEEIVFRAGVIFGDLYTRGDYAARSKAGPAGGDRLSQQ